MPGFKGFKLDMGPGPDKERSDTVMRALNAAPKTKTSFNGGGAGKPERENNPCFGEKDGKTCSGYISGNGMLCGPYSGTCKDEVCNGNIPINSPCLSPRNESDGG